MMLQCGCGKRTRTKANKRQTKKKEKDEGKYKYRDKYMDNNNNSVNNRTMSRLSVMTRIIVKGVGGLVLKSKRKIVKGVGFMEFTRWPQPH